MLASREGNIQVLKHLISLNPIIIDNQDENGRTV